MAQNDRKGEDVISEELGGTVVSTEVIHPGLSKADFSQISSFADAVAALGGVDAIPEASPEIVGDGSVRLEKDDLVGIPFIITGWTESIGENDQGEQTEFLVIRGITQSGTKFFITDGSQEAGLRPDLIGAEQKTGKRILMCPRGLTKSVYKVKGDPTGKMGTTFFIDARKRV